MEAHPNPNSGDHPDGYTGNVLTGEVFTDEALTKAGADEIEEVDVSNVHLVSWPHVKYWSLLHCLTPGRLQHWVTTNRQHGGKVIFICTPCAR